MKRKKINRELKFGALIISFYLVWAISWYFFSHFIEGSIFRPYLPFSDIRMELVPPLTKHYFLGTDIYGRSLFEILSSGLNYSLTIGIVVTSLCTFFGVIIGYLSVTGNNFVRVFSDLVTNLIFIFPSILIAILLMSYTGQSFWGLVAVLILTGWPSYAKIARGETKRLMGLSYVESARAIGMGKVRLFFTILLPGLMPILTIHMILGVSGVIISEATLGFLGLGGSKYSWGYLLSMAKTVLLEAPYIVAILSVSLAGLIIGLNLLGDGLRDYLDPKNV